MYKCHLCDQPTQQRGVSYVISDELSASYRKIILIRLTDGWSCKSFRAPQRVPCKLVHHFSSNMDREIYTIVLSRSETTINRGAPEKTMMTRIQLLGALASTIAANFLSFK